MFNESESKIVKIATKMETVCAILIIIAVIFSGYHIIRSTYGIFEIHTSYEAYEAFKKYLSHILLLVIGLEMAMMLVQNSPGSVIEVMLFAVARKMLIYSNTNIDMVIGTLALAGIFAIRKYLFISGMDCSDCRIMKTNPSPEKEAGGHH